MSGQLLNLGHGKLKKVMEKVIKGYGILNAQKSTNPDLCVCPEIDHKEEAIKIRE